MTHQYPGASDEKISTEHHNCGKDTAEYYATFFITLGSVLIYEYVCLHKVCDYGVIMLINPY